MGPSPPAVRDEVTQPPPGGASSRLCTDGSDLEHVTIGRRKASLQTLPGGRVVCLSQVATHDGLVEGPRPPSTPTYGYSH